MISTFTTDFAVLLIAATLLGFLARKTKQPTIVAYIVTGLIVGPIGYALLTHNILPFDLSVFLDGPIVSEDELIKTISELGLGFLLFLLGMEMSFDKVREIIKPVGAIAVGQATLQGVASTLVALLLGFDLFTSLMIALATTFGATPIIVKVLGDKDELNELYGRVDVGILIFQDLYLVVALAILGVGALSGYNEIVFQVSRVFFMMFVIGVAAYLTSKYVLPTLLRASASNATTLLTFGIAWAFLFIFTSDFFDVSIEIGAFLAGLALAQSPYSTELKERMSPVTNFFIVVFFASIGLTIEVSQLLVYWQEAVLASIMLLGINFCIVFGLYLSQNFDLETSFLGTISMLQVSEFSLVLGALAVQQNFVEPGILGFLSLMAIITMPLSTYYVMYNREIYEKVEPYLQRFERENPIQTRDISHEKHAVVIGYDESTRSLIPLIEESYSEVLIVEKDPAVVDELQTSGYDFESKDVSHELIYGDLIHDEIRTESSIDKASLVISMSPDHKLNKIILDKVDCLTILKAKSFEDAVELYDLGADYVVVKEYLAGEKVEDYLKLYLEDRELFMEEIETEKQKIKEATE